MEAANQDRDIEPSACQHLASVFAPVPVRAGRRGFQGLWFSGFSVCHTRSLSGANAHCAKHWQDQPVGISESLSSEDTFLLEMVNFLD